MNLLSISLEQFLKIVWWWSPFDRRSICRNHRLMNFIHFQQIYRHPRAGMANLFASTCQFFLQELQCGIGVPSTNLLWREGGVPNLK